MVHLDKLPVGSSSSRIMRTRRSFMFTNFPRETGSRISLSTDLCHTVSFTVRQFLLLSAFWALILTHWDRQEIQVHPQLHPQIWSSALQKITSHHTYSYSLRMWAPREQEKWFLHLGCQPIWVKVGWSYALAGTVLVYACCSSVSFNYCYLLLMKVTHLEDWVNH